MGGQEKGQPAPDSYDGKAEQRGCRKHLLIVILLTVMSLGVAVYLFYSVNNSSEKDDELRSCQAQRAEDNAQCDRKLQDIIRAMDGWQSYVILAIVVITLLLVAVILYNSRDTTLWQRKEATWQEKEATWQKKEAIWWKKEAIWQEKEATWGKKEATWQEKEATWEKRKTSLHNEKNEEKKKNDALQKKIEKSSQWFWNRWRS